MGYWENRLTARQKVYDGLMDRNIAYLYAAYNRAGKQIKADIKTIFDNFRNMYDLTEAKAKELLAAPADYDFLLALRARVTAMPNGPEKIKLMARLSAPAYEARISRMQAMQESARVALGNVANTEINRDTKALVEAGKEAYNRTAFDVQKETGLLFPVAGVSEKRILQIVKQRWTGANYSVRIWHNTQTAAELAAQAVSEMLMSGKASEHTFREIEKAVDEKVGNAKMAANRLLRTEYNHVTGQADMEAYDDCGYTHYRYVAVLDGRTSEICQQLDGKVFAIKDRKVGVNMHPMHPWCRSTTEPVFDDLVIENQTRWARDPVTGEEMHVPADMTYREWEKKMEELHGGASELKRKIRETRKKTK